MNKLEIQANFVGGVSGPYLGSTKLYFKVSAVEIHNSGSSPIFRSIYGIIPLSRKSKNYLITENNIPETTCPLTKNPLAFIKRRVKRDIRKLTNSFPRHTISLENNLSGTNWKETVKEGTKPRYDAHKTRDYVENFIPLSEIVGLL